MTDSSHNPAADSAAETQDWLESLDDVLTLNGGGRVTELLELLQAHAAKRGVVIPFNANTPYTNTIPPDAQPPYPGDREIERRIKSIIRWNAMAMVVRANKLNDGLGGHISTFASAATLYDVGFNHFFRGATDDHPGDLVFFQGHASPGMYGRAFVEGRLTEEQLTNFRRDLEGGLTSYPHPWLMPDFWQFPTVSMGLGPIMSIYQARFIRYLEDRGFKPESDQRVWAFIGDGETDEPETLGAISLAVREGLNNLTFVINCNLQRLDGPVRGNSQIVQELERVFRGAGWNVIKVLWGSDWDPLFAKDRHNKLVRALSELVDGEMQKLSVETGAYAREKFFSQDPDLEAMVEHLSDRDLEHLRRGGHDPVKVYAAYHEAMRSDRPTCILTLTVKGYGLGESGEGKNITHQQKKLNEDELRLFRDRFGIPVTDEDVAKMPFYRPPEDSPEAVYLRKRREELGGHLPARKVADVALDLPGDKPYQEFFAGTEGREVSTTMVFVRLLSHLLREKPFGKHIVPIIPDEARTFGMEALFRAVGIYAHQGQLYEPVDAASLLYYKEAQDGQILEEGINEAGAMSSFIAAGTSYSTHGIPMVPFYIYYSMFGFQRVGDLIWAAGDMRCRGFLLGATAGRTTLNGEGLQHQDGHSHLAALTVPNVVAYDPAFAFELAVIIRDGIRRMFGEQEDVFYYLTLGNENYPHPAMPEGAEEGILAGLYRVAPAPGGKHPTHLLGSGALLKDALEAQKILAETYDVAADVWSVTSYKNLYRDAVDADRWNRLHPDQKPRVPYVTRTLEKAKGPKVSVHDYMKVLPLSISPWVPGGLQALGTDGFGRSDTREGLRDFFEVDARHTVVATLSALAREGTVKPALVAQAIQDLNLDPEKANPAIS